LIFEESVVDTKEISTVIKTMLDVGGCQLHFRIWVGSDVVLVLEVGGGADSSMWGPFPDILVEGTDATVVTYDRAGFGKSDLPSTPYDMVEETHWLISGLQQLGLSGDIIMVGHSYGGWLTQLTASEFPGIVKGMVLVDPFNTEFINILGVDYLDQHPMATKNPPFASVSPESLTKNQLGLIRMVKDGLGPKVELMKRIQTPESLPVRIITSGEEWWHTPEENEAWRKSHKIMTASIPGVVLVVAEGCGHFIPEKQPGTIVDAVKEVILLKSGISH
jgi:pimeloyl-ACP methyl ester carboxylesterase